MEIMITKYKEENPGNMPWKLSTVAPTLPPETASTKAVQNRANRGVRNWRASGTSRTTRPTLVIGAQEAAAHSSLLLPQIFSGL